MDFKLSVLMAVVLFVCDAQASLDQLGDLGKGEEGFYKHCFVKQTLENLISVYKVKYWAVKHFSRDRNELIEKMDWEFMDYGNMMENDDGCSSKCYHALVEKETATPLIEETPLNELMCKRYAKLTRQCEIMEKRKSNTILGNEIVKWLCTTSNSLGLNMEAGYFECQNDANYPDKYRKAAEEEMEFVASITSSMLRDIKRHSYNLFRESDKLRRNCDNLIVQRAYSKLSDGIGHLSKYIECSKKEAIQKAEELSRIEDRQTEDLMTWMAQKMESGQENNSAYDEDDKVMLEIFSEFNNDQYEP